MKDVSELIAQTYGIEAARVYRAFKPNESDLIDLTEIGEKLLRLFPPTPGASVMMSALYAAGVRAVTKAPVYVVAGSLSVGGTHVFGQEGDIDGPARFSKADLSWNGHAWTMFGDRIADISIFRTAYSPNSPAALAKHVLQEFGSDRGVWICKVDDATKSGLSYEPQYVLSDHQVADLAREALTLLNQ
jgi:hypothetical protein